jgi:hypothetical protein
MAARRAKQSAFDIITLCRDRNLLGLSLSPTQEVVLRAAYGLPLSPAQRAIYLHITGRTQYPVGHVYQELTVVAGARSGKDSRIATPIAIYEALWGGHEQRLHRGEQGIIAIVAQDRDATGVAFNYIKGAVLGSPYLRSMLAGEPLSTELAFTNGIKVVTFPSSLRSLRAWSICVGICDELAFFKFEGGANSDAEIISSIRRGQVSFGEHAKLIKISTPFAKEGVLFDDFEAAYGKNDPDLLVVRAPTREMNPTIATRTLDREKRRDPKRYAREYEAIFADNVEAFIPQPLIDQAIQAGRTAIEAQSGRVYFGAIDASGGGACAFTLNICMLDERDYGGFAVVECQSRGWDRSKTQALDLEGTVREAASIFTGYGCYTVMSDRYSAGWVTQAFARHGISLLPAADKSATYAELEPLFVAGRIQLLDHPVKNRELGLLERRPRPGGKPLISPPRGSHDDYANSLALAAVAAAQNGDLPVIDTAPSEAEMSMLNEVFPQLELRSFRDFAE